MSFFPEKVPIQGEFFQIPKQVLSTKPQSSETGQLMNLTSTVRLTHLSVYSKLATDRVR